MPTPNSEQLRASGLTVLLHAAILGGLLLTFSHPTAPPGTTRLIPITVVTPNDLPRPVARDFATTQPVAPKPATPAPQKAIVPPPPASPAPSKLSNFNPLLLNSAQYNPALFKSGAAGTAQSASPAPPKPYASYGTPLSATSPALPPGKKGRTVVNTYRSRSNGYEAIITTYSDGTSSTQTIIQDSAIGVYDHTIDSGGPPP